MVAAIGDGALTGGMAYEALNQIAHLQPQNLIIVINDNGRSYAPTVGGLARHLSQLRIDPRYERVKVEISRILRDLPLVGATADQAAYRVKESLKQLLQPSTVFESLGIKYAGVVDGHDEAELEAVFSRAKKLKSPVVVHVVTEKGHGYGPAVEDEIDKLHGVGAFDPLTGRPRSTDLTYTDVFGEALMAAAMRRPEVCAITAAMASSTGLLNFAKEFPDRFFDVGICEQHAVTFAAGLAMAGMRPVVCIYSTFLARAFDQTIMDVALHKLPVVFVIDRAGVTGPDGSSHHGVFDLSYLRMIPNLKVVAPADATELCAVLETALATDGPVAIRYPKGPVPSTPDLPVEPLPVGRWEELRKGSDAVMFAVGRMVEVAQEAAERLALQDIECTVVNARWVKPVDPRIVDWARRRSRTTSAAAVSAARCWRRSLHMGWPAASACWPYRMSSCPRARPPTSSRHAASMPRASRSRHTRRSRTRSRARRGSSPKSYKREPVGSLSSPGAARAAALFPAEGILEIFLRGHASRYKDTPQDGLAELGLQSARR